MRLIDTKNYKGCKTEFFVLPKTESFFLERGLNLKDYLLNNFRWYEHKLFEILDVDDNRFIEKYTGKNFKVVFYGIIGRWVDKKSEGFVEEFEFDKLKVLKDGSVSIHIENKKPFAVREKILLDSM